jgi:biotin carboxyl carrier protein
MRYAVLWQDRQVDVEVLCVNDQGEVRITLDGREVQATVTGTPANEVGVVLGDRQFWAQIDGDTVWLGEQRLRAEVVDLRTLALRRAQDAAGNTDGPQPVRSPMPGRVAAVLVEEGQTVEQGQPLVVVEAMKMENELRAPKAGVVSQLSAPLGTTVELGAVLCLVQ